MVLVLQHLAKKVEVRRVLYPGLTLRVGREPSSCDIVVSWDQSVSRRHATIKVDRVGGSIKVTVTDQKSSIGTFVNGKKLEANVPTTVDVGNTIKFGSQTELSVSEVPIILCASGLGDNERERMTSLCTALSLPVRRELETEVSHIVVRADDWNATSKVLRGILEGKDIVTLEWLQRMRDHPAEGIPEPSLFRPGPMKEAYLKELRPALNLTQQFSQAPERELMEADFNSKTRSHIFSGLKFAFANENLAKSWKDLLKLGGASGFARVGEVPDLPSLVLVCPSPVLDYRSSHRNLARFSSVDQSNIVYSILTGHQLVALPADGRSTTGGNSSGPAQTNGESLKQNKPDGPSSKTSAARDSNTLGLTFRVPGLPRPSKGNPSIPDAEDDDIDDAPRISVKDVSKSMTHQETPKPARQQEKLAASSGPIGTESFHSAERSVNSKKMKSAEKMSLVVPTKVPSRNGEVGVEQSLSSLPSKPHLSSQSSVRGAKVDAQSSSSSVFSRIQNISNTDASGAVNKITPETRSVPGKIATVQSLQDAKEAQLPEVHSAKANSGASIGGERQSAVDSGSIASHDVFRFSDGLSSVPASITKPETRETRSTISGVSGTYAIDLKRPRVTLEFDDSTMFKKEDSTTAVVSSLSVPVPLSQRLARPNGFVPTAKMKKTFVSVKNTAAEAFDKIDPEEEESNRILAREILANDESAHISEKPFEIPFDSGWLTKQSGSISTNQNDDANRIRFTPVVETEKVPTVAIQPGKVAQKRGNAIDFKKFRKNNVTSGVLRQFKEVDVTVESGLVESLKHHELEEEERRLLSAFTEDPTVTVTGSKRQKIIDDFAEDLGKKKYKARGRKRRDSFDSQSESEGSAIEVAVDEFSETEEKHLSKAKLKKIVADSEEDEWDPVEDVQSDKNSVSPSSFKNNQKISFASSAKSSSISKANAPNLGKAGTTKSSLNLAPIKRGR